ncbi:hypothetical protein E6P09_06010 [Haloferax mediterranei ATCC 33500]|uniref:Uncharacterized protein n=1 Tax=Haloferax mediterranei (strain ATCC 33500 / DSM 1411 / JCM 8866 / NBRC 14739 / NCIMB 2177 / R-4) TaxID=523841 RepID=I3R259_HALMT|nr:hypothetical protein [Haloferax mediterranei]AFK18319.1 hypothetical protein HFX_0594 [Haloferax mediterranei ATCC 33500]AHZ22284.1 hypothetical protein BM92_06290 [Haloferax mediterranei ATCC 33500]EMA02411.1 hypothetical protein C439_07510 [Haloferax mediterranei ATCC 33500]MDX5988407.1 hypothetical protein [Haloferax mediterranei ATCC 33500]QCQ74834.1 hypothetical protein E6P09_06010 [Haloferax mediterranei ATCC 33500]
MRDPLGFDRGRGGSDVLSNESRGQLSLTMVEAAVATLFILAVAASFSLTPTAPVGTETALDQRATDAAALVADVPADGPGTFLGAACASPGDFDARAARLHEVATAGLPTGAFVSLRTDVGTVGTQPPETARVGTASVAVPRCTATLEVWYP